MLQAFGTAQRTRLTLVLLAVCLVLAAVAIAVGVADNPAGIALGLLSATALVVALAHAWRDSRRFGRLIYVSLSASVAFAVFDNLLAAAPWVSNIPATVENVLNTVATAVMLLCPAGLLVGIIGAIVTLRRERRSRLDPPAGLTKGST